MLVLEDIAASDWSAAQMRLEAALAVDPEDVEALDLQAYLQQASSGGLPVLEPDATVPEPTRPVDPLALACLLCGEACYERGTVLLNTRFASLMGWDMANRAAQIIVCSECSFVHWFVAGAPGIYQALGHDDSRVALQPASGPFSCQVCTYAEAVEVQRQINTRGLTLLGLDWLNRSATAQGCKRCGYLHWGPGPWRGRQPPKDLRDGVRCLCCGGATWQKRKALLNSRAMTLLGLDWLDEGAQVWDCHDCRALHWFRAEPKSDAEE